MSVNQSQVNWMIGRYVKDSHLDIFVASAFKIVNYNKVKSVVFDQVDSDTFRPLAPKVQYIVPVFVAIEMIVLYHENKLPKYTIDNPSSATYKFKQVQSINRLISSYSMPIISPIQMKTFRFPHHL